MKHSSGSFQRISGVLVFCTLFLAFAPLAWAESHFVDPALPLYQMSDRQKMVVEQLKFFDRTYQLWVNEDKSVASIWNCLAEEVFGPYRAMSCEGDAQGDAPFVLRGMLASGICSLYEAQALMEQGPHFRHQALVAYERGLETLEKVIRIAEGNPSINYLPNYTTALRTNANKDTYFMHPLAGCENILVGVDKLPVGLDSLFTRNLITNTSCETLLTWDLLTGEIAQKSLVYPFIPLAEYQEYCRGWCEAFTSKGLANGANNSWFMQGPTGDEIRNSFFKQGSTEATARFFLSEFCPWGFGVYLTLRDAGLTRGLDWRILRPFAGDAPQDLCELSITKPFLIPNHIRGEFDQIIGDGKPDFIDLEKQIPVQWEWVSQPPAYTIKYISPLVYERVRSNERFSQAMGYLKIVFGGPLDWAVDNISGELFNLVGYYSGKENEIYYASWVLFHANDKGFVNSDVIIDKEFKSGALFKKTVGAVFEALENFIVDKMYEGIDPRTVSLGTGYNGQPIPSIMMRGDVLGFLAVPDVEYGRTIQSVRHYVLQPSAIMLKAMGQPSIPAPKSLEQLASLHIKLPLMPESVAPSGLQYDLSKNEGLDALRKEAYLEEQWKNDPQKNEIVRRNAWEKLPDPFGSREYVIDFSPPYQIFKIDLPQKEFEHWTQTLPKEKLLHVQLWQRSSDQKNRLIINERIHDPALRLVVYNMHSPEGKSAFISAEGKYRSATHNRKIGTGKMHPETYRYFGPSDHRRQAVASLALERNNRLKSRYRLVITQGKDGENLAEYPLVIAPGRGAGGVPVTGKLSGLKDGAVVLDYNIPSKQFAGMSFFGAAGGERLDAWVQKEVKESSREAGIGGGPTFSVRSFVRMSFDEQGRCIIKDFKYTVRRAQRMSKSNWWFRHAWVTMQLHFDPVAVRDPLNISGTYTCVANGNTWEENIELIQGRNKRLITNARSTGTWTLSQQEGVWHFKIQPGQAPIPEMMAPIEVAFEED